MNNTTATEQQPQTLCKSDQDLYKIILKKIRAKAENLGVAPYKAMKALGFGQRLYYTIENFCKGAEIPNNMTKPLHEKELKKLCKALNIHFLGTYYMFKI